MFNPLSMEAPFDELQFINNLPAYDASIGTIEQLDLLREIQQSGGYYWQGLSFPNGAQGTLAANATVNGTLQVPMGSYVTSVTHHSTLAAGIKIKLWEKGSKASIFYGDYCLDRLCSSNMSTNAIWANPPSDPGSNQDIPFGPHYLMSPFIINAPGVLGWEVVNLANDTNLVQVLLCVAVPINKQSIGHRTISKT